MGQLCKYVFRCFPIDTTTTLQNKLMKIKNYENILNKVISIVLSIKIYFLYFTRQTVTICLFVKAIVNYN